MYQICFIKYYIIYMINIVTKICALNYANEIKNEIFYIRM